VIKMGVGVQNPNDCQPETPHFGKQLLRIPSRIDNDRLTGFRVP